MRSSARRIAAPCPDAAFPGTTSIASATGGPIRWNQKAPCAFHSCRVDRSRPEGPTSPPAIASGTRTATAPPRLRQRALSRARPDPPLSIPPHPNPPGAEGESAPPSARRAPEKRAAAEALRTGFPRSGTLGTARTATVGAAVSHAPMTTPRPGHSCRPSDWWFHDRLCHTDAPLHFCLPASTIGGPISPESKGGSKEI